MQLRDIIFFIALLVSIPFGHLVKKIKSPILKRHVCTLAGVCLVLFLNGFYDFWHSFIVIVATYNICKLSRWISWYNWLAFLFVFAYLFFFRTCTKYGLPRPSPYSDNVQLFMTLRMVGLAFEIRENCEKSQAINEEKNEHFKEMSFFHFLSFGYCYCGIFTGPYYKYQTYIDMLHQSNEDVIQSDEVAWRWLTYLPVFVVGYSFFSQWFPAYLHKDEFHNQSLMMQILMLALADVRFRCRIYIGTHMSESSAMTLCLGAYPTETLPKSGQGPSPYINNISENDRILKTEKYIHSALITKDKKYSFETIRGMYLRKVEFSSLKIMIRNWNTTVQWWMAAYVYQQFPFKKKIVRFSAVAAVSAFWHGIAPGYYMSFFFIMLAQMVQENCDYKFRAYLSEGKQKIYDWVSWFVGVRVLEYFGVGVWVHSLSITWQCWKSMNFYGHFVLVALLIISIIIPNPRKSNQSLAKHEKLS